MLKLNANLQKTIKEAIRTAGISQNAYAAQLGYSAGYFSMLLSGRAVMTEQARQKLIAAGISPEALTAQCPTCGQKLPISSSQMPNGKL